ATLGSAKRAATAGTSTATRVGSKRAVAAPAKNSATAPSAQAIAGPSKGCGTDIGLRDFHTTRGVDTGKAQGRGRNSTTIILAHDVRVGAGEAIEWWPDPVLLAPCLT